MGKGSHRSFFVCLKIGAAWFCPWGLTTFVRSRFHIVGVFSVNQWAQRSAGEARVTPAWLALPDRSMRGCVPDFRLQSDLSQRDPRQPRPGGLLSRRLRQRLCRFAVSLFRFSILWFLLLLLLPFLTPLKAEVWQSSCEFVAPSVVASFVVSSVTVDAATSVKDVLFVGIDVWLFEER